MKHETAVHGQRYGIKVNGHTSVRIRTFAQLDETFRIRRLFNVVSTAVQLFKSSRWLLMCSHAENADHKRFSCV